jgi:hypothetical protein
MGLRDNVKKAVGTVAAGLRLVLVCLPTPLLPSNTHFLFMRERERERERETETETETEGEGEGEGEGERQRERVCASLSVHVLRAG